MSSWSLMAKVKLAMSLITAATVALGTIVVGLTINGRSDQQKFFDHEVLMTRSVLPLEHALGEIHLDIVQVQQWLTDISATRGQDGLDDGFAEAASAADRLYTAIDHAQDIARQLNRPQLVDALDDTRASFEPYYQSGITMANAYVNGGPSQGNPLMAQFDVDAERLGQRVEILDAEIAQVIANAARETEEIRIAATQRNQILLLVSILTGIAVMLVIAAITMVSLKSIRKIIGIVALIEQASQGNLSNRSTGITDLDELGSLQHSLNAFLDQIELVIGEAAGVARAMSSKQFHRSPNSAALHGAFANCMVEMGEAARSSRLEYEKLQQARERFAEDVQAGMSEIQECASALLSQGTALQGASDVVEGKAQQLNTASNATASNMTIVASASEELSASIAEISRQIGESADMVSSSAEEAELANTQVQRLQSSADAIGEMVQLINEISEQTNLLALNATIEAARAGENGKGFAVVAQEVKSLASQTGTATERVRDQVSAIQSETGNVVSALGAIAEKVNAVSDAVNVVSSAVEEQQAATSHIAQNVDATNLEVSTIRSGAEDIHSQSRDTSDAVSAAIDASRLVEEKAAKTLRATDQFLKML